MDKRNLAGNASQGFSIRDRHLKKRIEEELGIPLEEKAPTVNAVFRTWVKRLRIWNCAIRKPLFTQVQKKEKKEAWRLSVTQRTEEWILVRSCSQRKR